MSRQGRPPYSILKEKNTFGWSSVTVVATAAGGTAGTRLESCPGA